MDATSKNPAGHWYGQQGEDFVAALLLGLIDPASPNLRLEPAPPDAPPVFVEVGCIDGRRFSNTLAFEQAGWQGLCIEAHPGYIDALRTNRPGSTVVHAAAGAHDADSIPFYANSRGTLSTLDPGLESQFRNNYGRYFTGFERIDVPLRKISTMLDDAGLDRIDLLSIDVEGCDAAALSGVDLKRHRPALIVIEIDSDPDARSINAQCTDAGYTPICSLSNNHFFIRDEECDVASRRLSAAPFRVQLTHTAHPLDDEPDQSRTHKVTPDFLHKPTAKASA
ncbi:MAG: FkbM family methyltransferase [Planctomycetota bacterium]